MPQTKRALLIGCPFDGLQGVYNDVDMMERVLKEQGFETNRLCGPKIRREHIYTAWQALNKASGCDDAVVVYYSGHGGLAISDKHPATRHDNDNKTPIHYQFLVPMDFDQSTSDDFRGILDIEISQLLRELTDKTTNATVIFDCCHSGRMARGEDSRIRALPDVYHHDISRYIARRRREGQLQGETYVEGNPCAVRISAAAIKESAFEHRGNNREWCGAMTEALALTVREGYRHGISWRSTLQRVGQLVNVRHPQQHPCVDGPENRMLFTVEESDAAKTKSFVLKADHGVPKILAGRIAGVHEGSVFAIMPLGSAHVDHNHKLADATVTRVDGFQAKVVISPAIANIPSEGAIAFLQQDSLAKWPIMLPAKLHHLHSSVGKSKFVRCFDTTEDSFPLASISVGQSRALLYTSSDVEIASVPANGGISKKDFAHLLSRAEQLARAQHLLTLRQDRRQTLRHSVIIDVGLVTDEKPGARIAQDGGGCLHEGEDLYIHLTNDGSSTVYVSVLDISVTGEITLINETWSGGIELAPGETYTLGKDQFDDYYDGLPISWPKGVPKAPRIEEWLVFVFSDRRADLRHLQDQDVPRGPGPMSELERVIDHIALGTKRDVGRDYADRGCYAITRVPLSLLSQRMLTRELSAPEDAPEWRDLFDEPATRGAFGALVRKIQGISPCVWIVNESKEKVTVVVSRYRPERLLSSGGINASTTGAGFDLSTTTFISPATTKILSPVSIDPESSKAVFPLWTRRDGFGVISIFVGEQRTLFIENDRIPIGSTAYFTGKPDLKIVKHNETLPDSPQAI